MTDFAAVVFERESLLGSPERARPAVSLSEEATSLALAPPRDAGTRPGRSLMFKTMPEADKALRGELGRLTGSLKYLSPGWYFVWTSSPSQVPEACSVLGRLQLGSKLPRNDASSFLNPIESAAEFAAPVQCARPAKGLVTYIADKTVVNHLLREFKATSTALRVDVASTTAAHSGASSRGSSTIPTSRARVWQKRLPRQTRSDQDSVRSTPCPALPPRSIVQGNLDVDGIRVIRPCARKTSSDQ